MRLLAEISKRGSADAFQISAIGSEFEVKRHNFDFAERRLKAKRIRDLLEFRGNRMCRRAAQKPRDLHCERRAARNEPPMAGDLENRPRERHRVYARVLPKPVILKGQQEGEICRAYLV